MLLLHNNAKAYSPNSLLTHKQLLFFHLFKKLHGTQMQVFRYVMLYFHLQN